MEKTLDFEKYQYAGLAASLAGSKENAQYIPGALEVLAGDKGLGWGEEALGFIRGTQASEKGIETAINVYNQKFQEKRGKYKPIDLAKWYHSVLTDLGDTEKTQILTTLEKHDETIKDIKKKFKIALRVVQSQEDDDLKDEYTPEQISEAKDTLEKYNGIINLMATLDNYKFEELRSDAVEATRKGSLEDLVKNL